MDDLIQRLRKIRHDYIVALEEIRSRKLMTRTNNVDDTRATETFLEAKVEELDHFIDRCRQNTPKG